MRRLAFECDDWLHALAHSKERELFLSLPEAAAERGVLLCVETHRSRSLNTPWATLAILKEIPDLSLTCDFSHWVSRYERLLDGCEEAVAVAARHAHHIHARVGHAQGP